MTDNKIVKRIAKQYGFSGFKALSKEMLLSDLQSLLIEVYNKRTEKITPKQLLEQYKKNRFVQPSKLDPKEILSFDSLAYSLLPENYQALQLAPVAPLGTISIVAPMSQNTVLTTIRNTEVCSDITNVMALEAAVRRKDMLKHKNNTNTCIRLAASHRLLRTQFYDNPVFIPHFQILSLCIAGKDEGSCKFEINTSCELIEYYSKLMHQYLHKHLIQGQKIIVKLFVKNSTLANMLEEQVKNIDADASIVVKNTAEENWNYYGQLRFKIFLLDNTSGEEFFICDGGDTNWTQQLLSNRKERYMISGLGSELFIQKIASLQ